MTDEVKITQTAHDLMFSDTLTKEEVHRILVTNSTSEFDKLRGVPGIAVDPIPWDTASNLVKENTVDSLAKLGRSPSGIVEYWTFKEKVGDQTRPSTLLKSTVMAKASLNRQGSLVDS